MDRIKGWRVVTSFAVAMGFVTGCALPSYKLPAGYSGSYERYLDAHDRSLPKLVVEPPLISPEPAAADAVIVP